jgi:hypothetical protein
MTSRNLQKKIYDSSRIFNATCNFTVNLGLKILCQGRFDNAEASHQNSSIKKFQRIVFSILNNTLFAFRPFYTIGGKSGDLDSPLI